MTSHADVELAEAVVDQVLPAGGDGASDGQRGRAGQSRARSMSLSAHCREKSAWSSARSIFSILAIAKPEARGPPARASTSTVWGTPSRWARALRLGRTLDQNASQVLRISFSRVASPGTPSQMVRWPSRPERGREHGSERVRIRRPGSAVDRTLRGPDSPRRGHRQSPRPPDGPRPRRSICRSRCAGGAHLRPHRARAKRAHHAAIDHGPQGVRRRRHGDDRVGGGHGVMSLGVAERPARRGRSPDPGCGSARGPPCRRPPAGRPSRHPWCRGRAPQPRHLVGRGVGHRTRIPSGEGPETGTESDMMASMKPGPRRPGRGRRPPAHRPRGRDCGCRRWRHPLRGGPAPTPRPTG